MQTAVGRRTRFGSSYLPDEPTGSDSPVVMAHPEKTTPSDSQAEQVPLGPILISVDDVGQFLALMSRCVVLGHSSDGQADLPFLANVGARHAELRRRDSLRDGTVWSVKPLGRECISINGSPVQESTRLRSGDLLRLSDNLALLFSSPDPASQSALLEVQGAGECLGAQRVVLMASGAGGRLRIGAGAQRLIRVPGLKQQLNLEWSEEQLWISCSEALLSLDGAAGESMVQLQLPLERRHQLALGQGRGSRPPFSLGFASPRSKGLARGAGASEAGPNQRSHD